MCLYEQEMINPRYTINKKNGGLVPIPKDKRLRYIKTACGWCKECRAKIARDWTIRLNEELKSNKNAQYITFSLSVESIIELEKDLYKTKYRGISDYQGETDVNLLASFAVRRWTERFRKKTKKAPRHFLITELGHTNSERIHLHGIVWEDKRIIEETWKYGNVYIGEWVDGRTITYITKYITKVDKIHKGYKQAIFLSKGIGREYVTRNKHIHQFNGENTNTKYKLKDGREIELPRYYKEKLWNEEEREELYLNTLNKNIISLGGEVIKNISIEEFNQKLNSVRENNLRAGYGNNQNIVRKYIITEAMKTHYNKLSERQKKVKFVEKRTIDERIKHKGDTKISKSNNTETIRYGEYTGTTTEAQRKYNELLREAKEKKISVKTLRLIKAGIITENC